MTGPMGERTELCFFPATEATGLANVHPHLGRYFRPGTRSFVLGQTFSPSCDCLPVTLFEAFDLWQEAYLTRFALGAEERDTRESTSHQKMGQGVILVTEPHAELNAGFVGLFASSHPAIFNWAQWNTETNNLIESELEVRCAKTADILTAPYWKMVSQYLCRRLSPLPVVSLAIWSYLQVMASVRRVGVSAPPGPMWRREGQGRNCTSGSPVWYVVSLVAALVVLRRYAFQGSCSSS